MDSFSFEIKKLGIAIKALRKGRGWVRRELAERSGISVRFLADVETGRANPSLSKLFDLADALETSPEALLEMAKSEKGERVRIVVALLGLRGAGKSSVGALLAKRLSRPFVELDDKIEEAAGVALPEIFEMQGERFYRRTEREVLASLLEDTEPIILATGGGIVTKKDSFELLRKRAYTIWLKARPRDHWDRVVAQGDTRPMADNDQAFYQLCTILEEREQRYRKADLAIETSGRSVEEIVDELVAEIE